MNRRSFLKTSLGALAPALLPCAAGWCADPKSASYRLSITEGSGYCTLRVYGRETDRLIWSRRVLSYGTVYREYWKGWSPDNRAVALPVDIGDQPEKALRCFLIWSAGYRVWIVPYPPTIPPKDGNNDYTLDEFIWSADNTRVLFRMSYSGGADMDMGDAYCADINRRRIYPIAKEVRRLKWVDRNTVHHWTASPKFPYRTAAKYSTWRAPR